MFKQKLLLVSTLLVIIFVVGTLGVSASIYNGTVEFTCTTWNASGSGSHVLNRDNTGFGQERITINLYDGAGTLLHTETYTNFLGTFGGGASSGTYDLAAPAYNPLRFEMISPAGNGLPAQVDFEATGSCAGLPTYAAPTTPNAAIPSGSVVGRLMFDTRAYYAPGNITDITLRAGQTYWVLGIDASGEFYKIALANNYLWVPVNVMSPNPDAPWNGTPLPTRTVS